MPIVRKEFQLTPQQVGWCIIALTASTILARLFFGWLCDRIGPRLAYTWLLAVGSLGVMGIGLAHDYTTFLLFRLIVGGIGSHLLNCAIHQQECPGSRLRHRRRRRECRRLCRRVPLQDGGAPSGRRPC